MKNTKISLKLEIVELETSNYHIFIQAKAGRNNLRLLVDTGASKSVINLPEISNLSGKWSEIPETESIGLGTEKVNTNLFILSSLSLNTIKLSRVEVAALDLSHVNQAYSQIQVPPIQGILGSDLLMKLKAQIDFGKERLLLIPSTRKRKS